MGDSDVDVQTAKAAGVPVILVSFGYAATALAGLEAEATIDHFEQLDVCAAWGQLEREELVAAIPDGFEIARDVELFQAYFPHEIRRVFERSLLLET